MGWLPDSDKIFHYTALPTYWLYVAVELYKKIDMHGKKTSKSCQQLL